MITWANEQRTLADLMPWERNPRQIDAAHGDRLAESVEEFGQVETLAIGPANELYNGHQRLKILMEQHGPDYVVDVRVASQPLTEKQREKLTIYLHHSATGEWDFTELGTWDATDLADWGFDLDLTDTGKEPSDAAPKADKAAELDAIWGVVPGDVWALGDHRLICGDCTEVLGALLAGQQAQILYTSPPYWVGFDYEQESTWSDVLAFIEIAAAEYVQHVAPDGRIIINTGTVQAGKLTNGAAHMRLLIDSWAAALERQGWLMRYIRFWVKDGGLLHTAPQSDCIDQHTEFLGYFYNPKAKFRGQERTGAPWAGKGYWDDIAGSARQSGHIAAFPVELPSRDIQLFTRHGEIILEPFGGSGTTAVAAENLGRRCYMAELDPKYCAVILDRMQTAFPAMKIERIANA